MREKAEEGEQRLRKREIRNEKLRLKKKEELGKNVTENTI